MTRSCKLISKLGVVLIAACAACALLLASCTQPQQAEEETVSEEEAASEEEFSFKPVGYGVQDIPAILKAGEESGAEWFIVEQDSPDKGNTELSAVKMSIEYLRKL